MSQRRVLIIEDDADAAGVLEAYLKRENFDIAICGDGRIGLDMAGRSASRRAYACHYDFGDGRSSR